MDPLLIEPQYLGPLEYYVLLLENPEPVTLEVQAHFTKQTYKNRMTILTSHGVRSLTVPVKYGNRTSLKEVEIDHSRSWFREHWGAFYSSYGKAPFFEFFASRFQEVWQRNHRFLVDLNLEMMSLCLEILQIDRSFDLTKNYQKNPVGRYNDLRERIHPKKPFAERKIYLPFRYTQLFGSKFAPNLSIVDLLMCEGNRAVEVLKKSSLLSGEHL